VEPGADERNEGRLGIFGGVVEVDGEERCGFAEADFAVGGGKELDVDDFTDGSFAVEEGAADEVGDIEGVGVERGELRGRDHQLTAGEEFGFGDGVGGSELEDNAPGIFADGEKVGLDGSRGGTRCGGIGRSRDEGDLAAFGELGRGIQVGMEFAEEFSATALGTQELGERDPAEVGLGCWGDERLLEAKTLPRVTMGRV